MLRQRVASILTVAVSFGTTALTASAQQTYAAKAQVVNAGVVILESSRANSAAQPVGATPHLWFNLDRNRSVKPAGWVFENPHPQTVLTGALYTRWNSIETGLGNPALVDGSRISKRNAAYWEVRLGDLSDDQLGDYDILVVSPLFQVQLNPSEREKLRHFVDRGGILWIDPAGLPATTGIDQGNNFPTPFALTGSGTAAEVRDYTQPLISSPNLLSDRDFSALAPNGANSAFARDIIAPTAGSLSTENLFGNSLADFASLKPVVGTSNAQFSIGVSRIGDGFVVVTGRGIAHRLNRVRTLNGDGSPNYSLTNNWSYTAQNPILEADGLAAAKIAVNMINLGREYGQPQGGSQRNSSSAVDIGAPLLRRSTDARVSGVETAPVLYKGFVVVAAGDTIQVYDADPARDIDGDSNPNDGDQNDGDLSGRDLIWQSNSLGSGLSSPVCVEVPNSSFTRADGSTISDMVLTVDTNGSLYALDLNAYDSTGRLSGAARGAITGAISAPGTGSSTQPSNGIYNGQSLPPTVHEGIAYVADSIGSSGGRIWQVDLASLSIIRSGIGEEWYFGAGKGSLPGFSAPPTVGYIPILDNSGGQDKLLYIPTPRTTGLSSSPAGFVSVWLGARGEKPTSYEVSGGALTITTRAAGAQLPIFLADDARDPRNVRITLIRDDGSVYSPTQIAAVLGTNVSQAQGVLSVSVLSGADLPADVSGVRVDYTIDWGEDGGSLTNLVRGDIKIPDIATGPVRDIRGSLALSPNGTLFFTASPAAGASNSKAAVFAYREEGRGAFKCVLRYELYPTHAFAGQGVSDFTVPPVFADVDPVTNFAPLFLQQPFASFTIPGPPAIRGGVAYVVAAGLKGIGIPTTVVMAFPADPPQPSIRVDNFPDGSVVVQPDLARSSVNRRPEVANVYNPAQLPGMSYDSETKLLKFDTLTTSSRGAQQAVLNLSQPIMIRRGGAGDSTPFFPNSENGNTFDPLLWYSVYNGMNATSWGLSVTGNTLFTSGTSRLRSILSNGSITPVEGMMYGLDVNISANDEFLVSMTGANWRQQLVQLATDGSGYRGNPAQKWPQLSSISGLDDYIVRLNQTYIPGTSTNTDVPVVFGMAAGEGVLAITSTSGLHTYSRSDFWVADQGRIAAFDPAGNPTFQIGTSASLGEDVSGNAGRVQPVVNPTRAYPQDDGSILVVDAGRNRVFRVDRAGIESRSINAIRLDVGHVPDSFPTNGPLGLKSPRDVVYYTSIEDQATVEGFFSASGAAYELWRHYLIADSGNHRLVEVVDRYTYDPVNRRVGSVVTIGGENQLGVLLWHSPNTVSGKGFEYNSLSRVYVNGRYVYFAGIGANRPAAADTGSVTPSAGALRGASGAGGVAVFDPLLPGGVKVFSQVQVPAIGANVFWNETTGSFNSAARAAETRTLVDVKSVTAQAINFSGTSVVRVMITDGTGVTEVEYDPTMTGQFAPNVVWMMPNEVYRVMRRSGSGDGVPTTENPANLRATYARRLETGEVLIVNGYFGQTRGTRNSDGTFSGRAPFRGEVVQVSGESGRFNVVNMGYGLRSITFSLELVSDTRGLVLPVFADRR